MLNDVESKKTSFSQPSLCKNMSMFESCCLASEETQQLGTCRMLRRWNALSISLLKCHVYARCRASQLPEVLGKMQQIASDVMAT